MEKYCNWCNKTIKIETHQEWMTHRVHCIGNPNKIKRINKATKSNTKKKDYILNCERCGDEYTLHITEKMYKKGKYKKNCSYKCANIRIHSKETKEKIKKSITKYVEKNIIKKTPFIKKCEWCDEKFKTMNEKAKFCRKGCASSYSNVNRIFTYENRKNYSNSMKQQYKNGRKIYGGTTKWYDVETSNGKIRVQGTYEVKMCEILDNKKKLNEIKNWEYTNDRFNYIGVDKKEHIYLIDFKVFNIDKTFYYLEVKGYKKENDELKWKAVIDAGHKLEVWYKKDIFK